MPRRQKQNGTRMVAYVAIVVAILVLSIYVYYSTLPHQAKPVILYVNQGNGVVNSSNFVSMLDFTSSKGFNTVFFQVYRQGALLFDAANLTSFVSEAHGHGLDLFFALYITNSSQRMPNAILGLGEDGISLDMSALSLGAQEDLLSTLKAAYQGETAVTTTDMTSPLHPGLLILETYTAATKQDIRQGIVGSVGVFATSSQADYQSQFQYAFSNSDGVMVFDYAGLLKSGY